MTHDALLISDDAVMLAEKWQQLANECLEPSEKSFQKRMEKLLESKNDKLFLTHMIDRSFRPKSTKRVADQVSALLETYGVPALCSVHEHALAQAFLYGGRYIPWVSVPMMINLIRKQCGLVILPEEKEALIPHLDKRKTQGVRMNINHLGEAILGETQAAALLETYLADLQRPEIEQISVKISTIYSQIHSIAFDHNIAVLKERLTKLFMAAAKRPFIKADGTSTPKMVNLDMEEYRDLDITSALFMDTLSQGELLKCTGGIALQSYLPDSFSVQKTITEWAKKRVADGGAPLKIRIVKGANLEMEKVESAIRCWPLATYNCKRDVDASYKRMIEYGLRPENIKAVHLGIASHNLFDMAWSYLLAKKRGVEDNIVFEMLEGMADHTRRAIMQTFDAMLMYAPVTGKQQFTSAIAYLIRRLDENTGRDNFLRHACNLTPGTEAWSFLKHQFTESLNSMDKLEETSFRTQDRKSETVSTKGTFYEGVFHNEADTDWALAENRSWAESIRGRWKKSQGDAPHKIPVVVAGDDIFENRETIKGYDLSLMGTETVCVSECAMAEESDILRAIDIAKDDPEGWRTMGFERRHKRLSAVANEIRKARGDLIGSAAAGTGKVFTEADIEISEAIDFAEYYPLSAKTASDLNHLKHTPKGTGLVISPWNFPIAIPCGGIVAALSSGNTVIFKPASSAVLPAWELCQCFWRAGISKNTLQFLPCRGDKAGSLLAGNPSIDFTIFTGGTDTALSILETHPASFFTGETGGKNATIVTAMADLDQAIKNIVHSAFSNTGQKCSATSLLILEKEVFNDQNFRAQLVDAARSWATGSAWEFETSMGPMIQPPSGVLKQALTTLEPGEEWALKPENINCNPQLWTPGIKWNVTPGSFTHMTEFFGPVLGVMCAEDLDHAIQLVNNTGYGLTSGIESLDETEQALWKERIRAGNLYVNRGTTGAVVLRQPFGGMGKSAIGSGIKAGGPNYVLQFMDYDNDGFPRIEAVASSNRLLLLMNQWRQLLISGAFFGLEEDIINLTNAVKSYSVAFEQEFGREKDYFHIRGQDNLFRYRPCGKIIIRLHETDTLFETLARVAAAEITGCKPVISIPEALENQVASFLSTAEGSAFVNSIEILRQSDTMLKQMIPNIDRIRYASPDRVPESVFREAAKTGFYISRTKVVMEGRIELLQYVREQSTCNTYHRYGNLGGRELNGD